MTSRKIFGGAGDGNETSAGRLAGFIRPAKGGFNFEFIFDGWCPLDYRIDSKMVFHLPRFKVPLLVVAMGAMVLSAGAQSSDRSIIFSTPKSDDTPSVTPSLAPQNSQLPVLPDSLQAPDPALHFQAPNDLPSAPPAAVNPLQARRMKQMLEDRKNWAQMTPEQILGTTPADELLQPSDRDALGGKKNAMPLDRYSDRENNLRGGFTNNWQNSRDNSPWNLSRDRNDLNPSAPGRDSMMDAAQRLNEYLNNRRFGDAAVNRNDKNFGGNSFSPSPVQKTAKSEMDRLAEIDRLAGMDRFRQLLNPSLAPATESASDSKYFSAAKTDPVVDPFLTQPDYLPNPAGAAFKPLTTGIGKPTGLTPLPGIVMPGTVPATIPAWAPHPAPWLLLGPQPFVTPQRKF